MTLIHGCAPSPGVKRTPEPDLGPELAQATELTAHGNYAAAAALYQQLAEDQSSPIREDLLLHAAENLFNASELAATEQLLKKIDPTALPSGLAFRAQLLRARIALLQGRADRALAQLESPPPELTEPALRRRYHQIRADAFDQTGNLLETARELSRMDRFVTDPQQQSDNQLRIIQRLTGLSDEALESLPLTPPNEIDGREFDGWIALAAIFRLMTQTPSDAQTRFEAWRWDYPNHPALPKLAEAYLLTREAQYQQLRNIAILLPQTGRFSKVAAALRDGIIAAYFDLSPERRPLLSFYDSSDPVEAWPLYQQAVANGADLVIGPLNKNAITQIANAGDLEVPVLALNQIPLNKPASKDLFLFGLAPEDEARQVAEKAWLKGYTHTVALTPQTTWGDRLFASFRDRWESLGGTLSEHGTYDTKAHDFSEPIRRLLNLDESAERHRQLEKTLGRKVDFEPRRRRDADFIFLAAHAQIARQIRPQLQYHYAADLPVYATSHAYSGEPDPRHDQDIEGLEFPDIPWLLADEGSARLSRRSFYQAMPGSQPRYSRVYALGIDSLKLVPHLLRLSTNPQETFDGKTGSLYLGIQNRIHRQLVWARIRNGTPQIIGYTPRLPPQMTQESGMAMELAPNVESGDEHPIEVADEPPQ